MNPKYTAEPPELTDDEVAAVQKILCDELDVRVEQLTPGASLDADLGADSLSKVEIVMAIEDRFGVIIPDELSEDVQTVSDVYDILAQVLKRQTPK